MFRSARDMVRINKQHDSYQEEVDEVYGCEHCSTGSWDSETEVEIHKNSKHKQKLKGLLYRYEHVCGICFEKFENNDDLLKHIKSNHLYSSEDAYRVEREIFVCDDCCQIFFNKRHLAIHISQNHSNSPDSTLVECPKCNCTFRRKQIWIHFHKHMVQSISTCRICFVKCKNRRELKEHLASHGHHFKCDMCGYNSKKSSLFNQHIRENHKRSGKDKRLKHFKRYFVPRNDVMVGKSQILMIFRGVAITNPVKICILCREICANVSDMKQHIAYEHSTPEIPIKNEYRCSCGVLFNNKVLLKHHIFKSQGDHAPVTAETPST